MSKHKTKEKWIKLFRKFETEDWNWEEYYVLVTPQKNPFNVSKYSIAFKKENIVNTLKQNTIYEKNLIISLWKRKLKQEAVNQKEI